MRVGGDSSLVLGRLSLKCLLVNEERCGLVGWIFWFGIRSGIKIGSYL